jgi:hypothetical protein
MGADNLLSDTILSNPGCFQGEDLELAQALLAKLQDFLSPPPNAKVIGITTMTDAELKIIDTANGCKPINTIKPLPAVKVPPGNDTTKPSSQAKPGQAVPNAAASATTPASGETNLLPVALGAAGVLALIYALTR